MDYMGVLEKLLDFIEREKIRCAITGGFAMGVLGAPRTTADIDFLIHKDDLAKIDVFLASSGYRRILNTENVSQYDHPDAAWGSLDFIHAFRAPSLEMLARAVVRPLGDGRSAHVLRAEDVIGLKLQALANDPARARHDMADIEALLEANAPGIDWTLLKTYFDLFERQAAYAELKARFGRG